MTRWSTTGIMGRHIFSCFPWTVDGCFRPDTLARALIMSPVQHIREGKKVRGHRGEGQMILLPPPPRCGSYRQVLRFSVSATVSDSMQCWESHPGLFVHPRQELYQSGHIPSKPHTVTITHLQSLGTKCNNLHSHYQLTSNLEIKENL